MDLDSGASHIWAFLCHPPSVSKLSACLTISCASLQIHGRTGMAAADVELAQKGQSCSAPPLKTRTSSLRRALSYCFQSLLDLCKYSEAQYMLLMLAL